MVNKELFDTIIKDRIKSKEELVKRYTGVWAKPQSYYDKINKLDKDIEKYKRLMSEL